MSQKVLSILRREVEGEHGQAERRAAAQFVADALSGNDATADAAAVLAESLADAALALANRLRGRTLADPVDGLRVTELRSLVQDVVDVLYGDGPGTSWSPDTLDQLADALARYGLVPDEDEE
jgi:hypothetical protein